MTRQSYFPNFPLVDPTAELSVWNGIVVTPQDSVYDSTLYDRKTGEEPEDEEVEEVEAPTTEKEADSAI